jgi:hypothetical protein
LARINGHNIILAAAGPPPPCSTSAPAVPPPLTRLLPTFPAAAAAVMVSPPPPPASIQVSKQLLSIPASAAKDLKFIRTLEDKINMGFKGITLSLLHGSRVMGSMLEKVGFK